MAHNLPLAPRPALTPPVNDQDHAVGSLHAPVQLVMFGDYECPHCQAAESNAQELLRRHPQIIRFVWRHFPLAKAHPLARHAALAAEIAHANGLFWQMHALLFSRSPQLARDNLTQYAIEIGLDPARFSAALDDPTLSATLQQHIKSGVQSGVNKTPTFYIQGLRFNGAYDIASLEPALLAAADLANPPGTISLGDANTPPDSSMTETHK
ncbi:MAG: thioredoxin domain-containing protein [Phycisphaerales bacterium]|nr:thioredoxin domain-containing protein [Phycisphaerales bacterium]